MQTRLEDVVQARNPTDPFAGKPEIGAELRAALRARGLTLRRVVHSAAELQRLHRPAAVGIDHDEVDLARMRRASAPRRQLEARVCGAPARADQAGTVW